MINRWKAGEKQEKPRDSIQKVHRRPHRARSCKVRARLRQEFRRLQAACGAVSWDILGYGLGTHTSKGFPPGALQVQMWEDPCVPAVRR